MIKKFLFLDSHNWVADPITSWSRIHWVVYGHNKHHWRRDSFLYGLFSMATNKNFQYSLFKSLKSANKMVTDARKWPVFHCQLLVFVYMFVFCMTATWEKSIYETENIINNVLRSKCHHAMCLPTNIAIWFMDILKTPIRIDFFYTLEITSRRNCK